MDTGRAVPLDPMPAPNPRNLDRMQTAKAGYELLNSDRLFVFVVHKPSLPTSLWVYLLFLDLLETK